MEHAGVHDHPRAAERAQAQDRFFATHIQPWYGALCDALDTAAGANFYRRVSQYARSFLDVEAAVGDLLEVGQHDLLGPLVDVGAGADGLDLLIEPLLGALELLPGGLLGGLRFGLALLDELLRLRLQPQQGPMLEASLAEVHEGVVAGQHVDAVEHERDVVELQVLDPAPTEAELATVAAQSTLPWMSDPAHAARFNNRPT